MGILKEDLDEILSLKSYAKNLDCCAILGDCSFHDNIKADDLGFSVIDTLDINGSPTHKVDLQLPLEENFHEKYDVVLDCGTLFCVFDIVQCLKNILFMLKTNGIVYHESNLVGHFGRGFYALSPSFFNEFYEANGFNIIKLAYKVKWNFKRKWVEIPPKKQYLKGIDKNTLVWSSSIASTTDHIPNDMSMLCIAQKTTKLKHLNFPSPYHYKK